MSINVRTFLFLSLENQGCVTIAMQWSDKLFLESLAQEQNYEIALHLSNGKMLLQ